MVPESPSSVGRLVLPTCVASRNRVILCHLSDIVKNLGSRQGPHQPGRPLQASGPLWFRTCLIDAGFPLTMTFPGMSPVTTDPAVMTVPLPIWTPPLFSVSINTSKIDIAELT